MTRTLKATTVTLAHGGGGKAMKDLVEDVFIGAFGAPGGTPLEDQARLDLGELTRGGDRLAFTTDSYVVDPLFFPGGDIGTLAVYGTCNDLAVGGATPRFLSCAVIVEEGVECALLRRVAGSMAGAARRVGVEIVTGDTKVVPRGACDQLFVTTTGIGVIPRGRELRVSAARPGDALLVNGWLGDHGAAILGARGEMRLDSSIESDCAPLSELIEVLLSAAPGTRGLRDATRGGIATVVNEMAEASRVGVELEEDALPVRAEVRGFCELLGLDPLYLANEGKFVAIVPIAELDAAIAALRTHSLGARAVAIGRVTDGEPGRVTMHTLLGGTRIVDMLVGEQLPRIC
jgi:hydrogenase expression/formation protein HypE